MADDLLFDAPSSVISESDVSGDILYLASALFLTEAITLPECDVSVNSRKQIIGATSVRPVGRVYVLPELFLLPLLPVLAAAKTISGSRTMLSRIQKKDARQFDVDQMSLVVPATGSPHLTRCMLITTSSLFSVSVRIKPRSLMHVCRCGRPADGLRPRT